MIAPLLLPDRCPTESLSSLASLRSSYRSTEAQASLKQLQQDLLSTAETVVVDQACKIEDHFETCIFLLAMADKLILYVGAIHGAYCHRLDLASHPMPVPGFSLPEAIRSGHFSVAPSLMRHQSLEVRLAGQPLLVDSKEIRRALTRGPTSQATLTDIIRSIINQADSGGTTLTNSQIVYAVQSDADVHGISNNHILEIAKRFKPESWCRPGRKRNPSRGR